MTKQDKKVVEKLLDGQYGNWINDVRELLCQENSPLSLKNGTWSVTKRKEMWQELGPYLFDEHLDKFRKIAVEVLRESNPMFELSPDKRYMANLKGKVLQHSETIRKGLSETMALLGTQPEALEKCSSGKAESTAIIAIRKIFENSDWVLWGSLNPLLPTLAEACPDEFLNAVENALNKKPCPFDELFSQEGSGITGSNYMTGLLWALETLAWDPEYLVRTTVILGKLASRDPGGNWANRPTNSLVTIFLPWMPQTIASIEKRKVAIKTLQKECPEVAWKLLLDILPNRHQSTSGSHRPVWRKIIPDDWEKGVTKKEYWSQVSSYADIAVEMAKGDVAKLNELISYLDNLPKPSFEKILEYLKSKEIKQSSEEQRTPLWEALVKFAIKHKKYSDADWSLSQELVEKIEQVAEKLTPKEPKNLYRRLFNEGAIELYEEKDNWEEQEEKLERCRQDAIKMIIAHGGLEAVFKFAENVSFPEEVGGSLGIVAEDAVDSDILPALLDTDDEKLSLLARRFVWSRRWSKGWEWIDQIDVSGWSKVQIGKFLSCLPFKEKTWQYSEKLLREFEVEYWSRAVVNPYQAKDNIDLAIDLLIKYNRPNAAIDCLGRMLYEKKPLDKSKAVNALLKAVSSAEMFNQMSEHYVTEIIQMLQDDPEVNQDDLLNIEWAYLPILTGPGKSGSPKLLEQKLASDPDFFCEAIRLIYRSKHETESSKEPSERQKIIAENALRLLDDWSALPGSYTDAGFSVDNFNNWLSCVKQKCEETGHLEVALSTIGKALIHYFPDPDGLWIHRALAEALNQEDADKMRNGFEIGIFNSRGVHFIDPTGKPEKELAAKYRQQAEEVEDAGYHRFADTLRRLAVTYEEEAKRIIEDHRKSVG